MWFQYHDTLEGGLRRASLRKPLVANAFQLLCALISSLPKPSCHKTPSNLSLLRSRILLVCLDKQHLLPIPRTYIRHAQ